AWIHKVYYEELNQYDLKTLQKYLCQTNIPDPKEWSQEYPMYCSQAIRDTPTWMNKHEDTSFWKDIHEVTPPDDLEQRIEQLELKCYRAREEKK
ncbi:hypothetical protein Gohar_000801, partial [Gossypium harknessii]|nr:hypothetical protein [Gossypium harknessii]